ncbi:Calcium-binding EF-hand [Corchorus olitorius]|uniref:Calcium-binding EF-hand n=1 Tax=Corchorus olitorius TaxID=93759 RepID=A0A1R3JKU4_9ROSI|nr:Calcium-binding EF-hand [Corchorus olitorius]
MNEIRETARAYHANLSQDEKTEATKIFKSMDSDGDGKINLTEFRAWVTKEETGRHDYESLFKMLDKDEDGNLEFEDVLALFYLHNTRRFLFCEGCKAFIKGVYFTCVECFNDVACDSYILCCSCYRNSFFLHHDDHKTFADNYHLLSIWKMVKGISKWGIS